MDTSQALHEFEAAPAGRKNVYACNSCNRIIMTIDRDEGVTPMFLKCRATDGCPGQMQSSFYRVDPSLAAFEPNWEWRKPTEAEYAKLDKATREDHVDRGGLMLYPIAPDPIKAFDKLHKGLWRQRTYGANRSKAARQSLKEITKQAIRKAKKANGGRLTDEQMVAVQAGVREALMNVRESNAASFEELAVVNAL